MMVVSTRTMTIDVAKHKNNANETAKQENSDKLVDEHKNIGK